MVNPTLTSIETKWGKKKRKQDFRKSIKNKQSKLREIVATTLTSVLKKSGVKKQQISETRIIIEKQWKQMSLDTKFNI